MSIEVPTLAEQIREIELEIFACEVSFDNAVRARRMSLHQSQFRMACKRAVLRTLRGLEGQVAHAA